MDAVVVVAGLICIAMALGHTLVGARWVLPAVARQRVPGTPVGPPSLTMAMLRVTWYVVTVFVLGIGGILLTLAWTGADPRTVLLRWLAGMWLAATAMVAVVAPVRRNVGNFLRLPVPVLWVVVAVLCWAAST